jgi:hypothetical protein
MIFQSGQPHPGEGSRSTAHPLLTRPAPKGALPRLTVSCPKALDRLEHHWKN